MWAVILAATGLGLAGSIVALVEALSTLKYPCANIDDSMVDAAVALDYARAVSGFLLTMVVMYGHANQKRAVLAKEIVRVNVAALVTTIIATLFVAVVQKSEACSNCVTDDGVDDDALFEEERFRMLGATCPTLRAPEFRIPENYCRAQLEYACPAVTSDNFAERCLVYACSSQVHGMTFRYLYGIAGMACHLIAGLLLLMNIDALFDRIPMVEYAKKDHQHDEYAQAGHQPASAPPPPAGMESHVPLAEVVGTAVKVRELKAGNGSRLLFPRPRQTALRQRSNGATYSRVRQLDF